MDPKREALVLYHLRRAHAELALAHATTDSRQIMRVGEHLLSQLDDLLYNLQEANAEQTEPPEFPFYIGSDGQEHGEY